MALAIRLEIESISEDGNSLIVKDATGEYSTGNTGGYGETTLARSAIRLFLLADRFHSWLREPLEVQEFYGASPESATKWLVKTPVDGAMEFLMVGAFPVTENDVYAKGEVVAYNSSLYKALASAAFTASINPAVWKKLEKVSDYTDTDSYETYSYITAHLHYYHSDIYRRNKALNMSRAGVGALNFEQLAKEYLWLTVTFDAAVVAAQFGDFHEAGDALEEVENLKKLDAKC